MTMRLTFACLIVAGAAGIVAIFHLSNARQNSPAMTGSAAVSVDTRPAGNVASVAARPTLVDTVGSGSRPKFAPVQGPDAAVAAFLGSTNFARTHLELSKLNTPEAKFVMAHLQETCARIQQVEQLGPAYADPRLRSLVGSDNLELRRQAQARLRERSARLLCADFPKELTTPISIAAAMEQAALAGDLRAKLRMLEDRMIESRTVLNVIGTPKDTLMFGDTSIGMAPRLSAEDFALLRSAFESKDPIAIRAAGPLLSGVYRDTQVSFGALSAPVDGVIGDSVWRLLACRYGGGCDTTSSDLSEACVLASRCDVADLADYIMRYDLRPEEATEVAALVDRFQRAIDQGDWRFLTLNPSATPRFDRTPFPAKSRPFVLRP